MEEKNCFNYEGFKHIAYHCRNIEKERSVLIISNRWKVLRDRVIQRGEESEGEIIKNRREILRKERAKKGIEVQ